MDYIIEHVVWFCCIPPVFSSTQKRRGSLCQVSTKHWFICSASLVCFSGPFELLQPSQAVSMRSISFSWESPHWIPTSSLALGRRCTVMAAEIYMCRGCGASLCEAGFDQVQSLSLTWTYAGPHSPLCQWWEQSKQHIWMWTGPSSSTKQWSLRRWVGGWDKVRKKAGDFALTRVVVYQLFFFVHINLQCK